MTSSTSNSEPTLRLGTWLLAILAASLVVLPWALWITKAEPLRKTPRVAAMEAALAQSPPEVVIVGNSMVDRGFDLELLSQALGLEPGEVSMLHVPGTSLPASYLLLKNRVYANGHRPRLVVVGLTVQALFDLAWPEGQTLTRLKEQMEASEPLISRKMDGRNHLLGRYLDNRAIAREKLLDGVRDRALKTFGIKGVEEALGRVFADENVSAERGARVIPIVEGQVKRQDAAMNRSLQASLVPDVIALAHRFGSRVVFLRMPLRPGYRGDQQTPATLRELTLFVEGLGARFVDLANVGLEDVHFEDVQHLSREGERIFSGVVGETLLKMGALGEGPMARSRPPLQIARIVRTGAPASLPKPTEPVGAEGCRSLLLLPELWEISDAVLQKRGIGALSPLQLAQRGRPLEMHDSDACEGAASHITKGLLFAPLGGDSEGLELGWSESLVIEDAKGRVGWWVYPGTTLEIDLAEPWDPRRGELEVRAIVERFGDGEGSLRIGDQSWPIAGRRRVDLRARPATPATPLQLRLESPPGGSLLLLRYLSLTSGATLLGEKSATLPPSVRVLGLMQAGQEIGVAGPPPPVAVAKQWSTKSRPDVRFLEPEKAVTFLGYEPLGKMLGTVNRCSPVRVLVDGEVLPTQGVFRGTVMEQAGTASHVGDVVLASTLQGGPAAAHDFSLALDPERRCRYVHWLYPGDRWLGQVLGSSLWTLADGVWGLSVLATAPGGAEVPGMLELRVFAAGNDGPQKDSLFAAEISHDRLLDGRAQRLLSDVELLSARQGLVVELHNRGQGFVLLQAVDLIGDASTRGGEL